MAALGFFLTTGAAVVAGFEADLAEGFVVGSLAPDFAASFAGAFFACVFAFGLRCATFLGAGFPATAAFGATGAGLAGVGVSLASVAAGLASCGLNVTFSPSPGLPVRGEACAGFLVGMT